MEKKSLKCESNFWETIGDSLVDDISVLDWEIIIFQPKEDQHVKL